jgi:hypothetical protein
LFPNHLEISSLEVTEASTNHELVARGTNRKIRFVRETHREVHGPALDGMSDRVHDLVVNLGISAAKAVVFSFDALVELPPLLRGNRTWG